MYLVPYIYFEEIDKEIKFEQQQYSFAFHFPNLIAIPQRGYNFSIQRYNYTRNSRKYVIDYKKRQIKHQYQDLLKEHNQEADYKLYQIVALYPVQTLMMTYTYKKDVFAFLMVNKNIIYSIYFDEITDGVDGQIFNHIFKMQGVTPHYDIIDNKKLIYGFTIAQLTKTENNQKFPQVLQT